MLLQIFDICLQVDRLGGVSCLTDENTETYWESDGMQGQHWIRLHMKRGTVVKYAAKQQNSYKEYNNAQKLTKKNSIILLQNFKTAKTKSCENFQKKAVKAMFLN